MSPSTRLRLGARHRVPSPKLAVRLSPNTTRSRRRSSHDRRRRHFPEANAPAPRAPAPACDDYDRRGRGDLGRLHDDGGRRRGSTRRAPRRAVITMANHISAGGRHRQGAAAGEPSREAVCQRRQQCDDGGGGADREVLDRRRGGARGLSATTAPVAWGPTPAAASSPESGPRGRRCVRSDHRAFRRRLRRTRGRGTSLRRHRTSPAAFRRAASLPRLRARRPHRRLHAGPPGARRGPRAREAGGTALRGLVLAALGPARRPRNAAGGAAGGERASPPAPAPARGPRWWLPVVTRLPDALSTAGPVEHLADRVKPPRRRRARGAAAPPGAARVGRSAGSARPWYE